MEITAAPKAGPGLLDKKQPSSPSVLQHLQKHKADKETKLAQEEAMGMLRKMIVAQIMIEHYRYRKLRRTQNKLAEVNPAVALVSNP